MRHGAIRQVFEVDFNSIAHAYTEEGTGHLAVECPILVGSPVSELALDFNSFQINAHGMWCPRGETSGNFRRVTYDIGACSSRVIDNYGTADHDTITNRRSCRSGIERGA